MKKLLTLFACAALLGTACTKDKDDNGGKVRTYDVSVRLVYPEGSELSAVAGIEVRMTNGSSGTVTTATTDAAGTASFKLTEGIYEAAATDRRSLEGYTYTLNALKSNVVVSAATWSEGMTVDLELVASRAGQILIKEVYSGGCQKDDGSGFYQYDKYMVIYNNSDQKAEIRNFCVGMAGPYNANTAINNYVNGKLFYADAGYTPTICAYWYLKKELVLEPYASASIVLCGAINHTTTYQNSVDLSRADYCTYDPEVFSNTLYYPAPAESIPAENYLKAVFFGKGNAWPVSIVGPAMFIFSTGDEDPAAWGLNTQNRYYFPGKENNDVYGCTKIPNDWILDAVEIYGADFVTESLPRFTATLDAGYAVLTNKQGYSIYRNVDKEATEALSENAGKIVYGYALGTLDYKGAQSTDPSGIDAEASIRNGAHILYLDTNNSSNDFHQRAKASLKE